MVLALPKILYEDKYKDTWTWDGWKPKAKEDAPQEVKDAIEEWVSEATDEEEESADWDSEFASSESK